MGGSRERAQSAEEREARLKAALKANMARRKVQARVRAEGEAPRSGGEPDGERD